MQPRKTIPKEEEAKEENEREEGNSQKEGPRSMSTRFASAESHRHMPRVRHRLRDVVGAAGNARSLAGLVSSSFHDLLEMVRSPHKG